MTLVAQVVIFLVLVWLLAKFAYKPLTRMLDERSRRIADDLRKAEEDRLGAERLKSEYQEQLNQARVKAQEIVEKAQRQVEIDTERQLSELRAQIERMKQTAEEEIAREHEGCRRCRGRAARKRGRPRARSRRSGRCAAGELPCRAARRRR